MSEIDATLLRDEEERLETERLERPAEAKFPVGTLVTDDDDDPIEPEEIGIVVEPTPAELAEAEQELCGFTTGDADAYVLVEWPPGEFRDWRPVDYLQRFFPRAA
jgi:hypothetical protein